MFKSIAAAVIAATTQAALPTNAERFEVQAWDTTMKYFERDQYYEIYKTTTEDDYVLTLFRLLPKTDTPPPKKGTILLQHGASMEALSWIMIATFDPTVTVLDTDMWLFNLVDEGYDVFLGNNRNTQYSQENKNFPDADNPDSPNYAVQNKAKYDNGWYEMGQYDLPALLDGVQKVSPGKVNYIGYS